MKKIIILLVAILVVSCQSKAQSKKEKKTFKITKSEAEWKNSLSKDEFYVLRKKGTEPRYSSKFNYNDQEGFYSCSACGTALFESDYQYNSGSGWPSFDREIKGNVAYSTDNNLGYTRVEEHCANCGGHLGHVFNDGPIETTGKRHCINGISLKFTPTKTSDEK